MTKQPSLFRHGGFLERKAKSTGDAVTGARKAETYPPAIPNVIKLYGHNVRIFAIN